MRKAEILLLITACILLITPFTVEGAFGPVEVSARPMGMGGAFIGVADDVTALYYNPSGLIQITTWEGHLFYADKYNLQNYTLNFFAMARSFSCRTFAFAYLEEGTLLKEVNYGKTNYNSLYERRFFLSWAEELAGNLSAGINFKVLHLKSSLSSDFGWGLDAGFLYRRDRDAFGLVLRDPYTVVRNEKVPSSLELGYSRKLPWKTRLSADLIISSNPASPENLMFTYKAGIENKYLGPLNLRLGFNNGSPSLGFGLEQKGVRMDYAFVTAPIGTSHLISINFEIK